MWTEQSKLSGAGANSMTALDLNKPHLADERVTQQKAWERFILQIGWRVWHEETKGFTKGSLILERFGQIF